WRGPMRPSSRSCFVRHLSSAFGANGCHTSPGLRPWGLERTGKRAIRASTTPY
ncbi:MAG: hypothetical protein AVDCRST_MAG37-2146, partial [uncultured Rubrobacteraceae bacterium]